MPKLEGTRITNLKLSHISNNERMTRLLSLMPRIFSRIPRYFSREEKYPTVKQNTITFQYPFQLEA